MNAGPQHVIFGTGAIGLATLDALRRRGETVRLVNRSGTAPVPDDVEVVGGDASDPAFTTAAARGARVVYQTLNPPYHQWAELFPALQAGVLAAAEASGARLVSMENVYMYGRPDGQPLTETRPYAAHTKKGQLRARMARELLAAHQAGHVQVASAAPRTTSVPAAAPSPTSATGSSRPPWPARPPPSSATPTSPTPTPTSPTSAKASPSSANTPTPRARSGTSPTTPTPGPPASWSTSSTGWPASPGPGSAAPRCSCFEPWASPTPRCGNCSRCSTSSRSPSSSTAARSPPSSASTPPRWTRPSPTPSPPTAPAQHRKPAGLRRALRRISRLVPSAGPPPDRGESTTMDAPNATTSAPVTAVMAGHGHRPVTGRKATMQAIVQDRYGCADVLELADIGRPVPIGNEVLMQVQAAGLHRGDWHVMTGLPYLIRIVVPALGLRKPKTPVLGMDVAGRVEAVGSTVTRFRRVRGFGWCDGAFAEYASAPTGPARGQASQPQLRAGRGRPHLRVRRPPGACGTWARSKPGRRSWSSGRPARWGRSGCSWPRRSGRR